MLCLHPGDDQVSQAGPEHGRGFPVDDEAAIGPGPASQPGRQRDRAAGGSVREAGQQLAGPLGQCQRVGGQHGAGQHGRQASAGHQRTAKFLKRHGQLGQAVSLAAAILRHMQAEDALLGQGGPERLPVPH